MKIAFFLWVLFVAGTCLAEDPDWMSQDSDTPGTKVLLEIPANADEMSDLMPYEIRGDKVYYIRATTIFFDGDTETSITIHTDKRVELNGITAEQVIVKLVNAILLVAEHN